MGLVKARWHFCKELTMAGKGDTPRPVNGERYRYNYDLIFVTKPQPKDDEDKQPTPPAKANVEND
jgi:hypothetical protein